MLTKGFPLSFSIGQWHKQRIWWVGRVGGDKKKSEKVIFDDWMEKFIPSSLMIHLSKKTSSKLNENDNKYDLWQFLFHLVSRRLLEIFYESYTFFSSFCVLGWNGNEMKAEEKLEHHDYCKESLFFDIAHIKWEKENHHLKRQNSQGSSLYSFSFFYSFIS